MANSTLVVVMGANPAENHPASIGHINKARAGGGGHRKAQLIVIDPRKTRTAAMADKFIRIRPGTDIAFVSGLIRRIIEWMEANPADPKSVKFFEYLNRGVTNKAFQTDAGGTANSTVAGWLTYCDARLRVAPGDLDYLRASTPAAAGNIADLPVRSTDCRASVSGDTDTVYERLKAHVANYTAAEVALICGCNEADLEYVAQAYIDNSRCASNEAIGGQQDPNQMGWRSTTMLYAMGLTQHTHGSQNVKSFAQLQTIMGNVGRLGGGINALRGIHNVQGSTDMGVLRHLIPGYSGNPIRQRSSDANAFGQYMDGLWGNRLSGNGYDDAYDRGIMSLQQSGFYNMTRTFFGDYSVGLMATALADRKAEMDRLYDLWPKTNGDHHIEMFRKMKAGTITACFVLGQNPAVTEPNQGAVRDGLRELDLLVVEDVFETETAAADRKAGGVTFLLPSCTYVEKAGSSTNSGRTLQWREKAVDCRGNSRSDLEYIFRLAKAFDDAGCFSHITDAWSDLGKYVGLSAYDVIWGGQYGYTPAVGVRMDTEAVASKAYIQMNTNCQSAGGIDANGVDGGTLWIYTQAYNTSTSNQLPTLPGGVLDGTNTGVWQDPIRAKSRDNFDYGNVKGFQRWGYAWLVNRRVLYNNGEINDGAGGLLDNSDGFQRPEGIASIFTTRHAASTWPAGTGVVDYARGNYRFYHKLADRALTGVAAQTGKVEGFSFHAEPYESPYDGARPGLPNLVAKYGHNSGAGATEGTKNLIVKTGGFQGRDATPAGWDPSAVGTSADYPLVLTTIRCVEHFQGGPITRNNWHNVEIEPEPWIELSSYDANRYGIKHGDMVKIVTARTESYASDSIESEFPRALEGQGYRARVGVGLKDNQRVGEGVVAIPWHWGDRGLSTGSRANDLCIDAWDANTQIPEYKACLCRIEKI